MLLARSRQIQTASCPLPRCPVRPSSPHSATLPPKPAFWIKRRPKISNGAGAIGCQVQGRAAEKGRAGHRKGNKRAGTRTWNPASRRQDPRLRPPAGPRLQAVLAFSLRFSERPSSLATGLRSYLQIRDARPGLFWGGLSSWLRDGHGGVILVRAPGWTGRWEKFGGYSVFGRAAGVGTAVRVIFHADLPHSASSTSFRSHGACLSRSIGPSPPCPPGKTSEVDWWRRAF